MEGSQNSEEGGRLKKERSNEETEREGDLIVFTEEECTKAHKLTYHRKM
jgi:hypothetical protein